ncbi:DUF3047 domain-containing protein [Planctomycetota bacterium]
MNSKQAATILICTVVTLCVSTAFAEPLVVDWSQLDKFESENISNLLGKTVWLSSSGKEAVWGGSSTIKPGSGGELTLDCRSGFVGAVYLLTDDQKKIDYTTASWQWRVDKFASSDDSDELARDQPIQVAFLTTVVTNGTTPIQFPTLSYVWSTGDPAKVPKHYASPRLIKVIEADVHVVAARAGPNANDDWQQETINLKKAIRRLPNAQNSKVFAIAVFADTNHTESHSRAAIRNITLSAE